MKEDICYKIEKVSDREKAILFDYEGMAQDNEIVKIVKREGL